MKAEDPKDRRGKKESIHKKISEKFEKLRKNEKMEELYQFATANTRDTIVYALLVIGLILLLFVPFWGGLIIGVIGGIYFADDLLTWFNDINDYMDKEGLARLVILGGIGIAFLIAAPGIIIGAVVAVAIKKIVAV